MIYNRQAALRSTCAVIATLLLSACSQEPADVKAKGEASPHLLIFAGDDNEQDSDFMVTFDVDPKSKTFGEPVLSQPVAHKNSMPHHMEYVAPPKGEPIFMNSHHPEVSYIVDVSDEGAASVNMTFKPPAPFRYPHDYTRTPSGTRLVGFLRSEGPSPDPTEELIPAGHGGVAEYNTNGDLLRSVSAGVPDMKKAVRPYAFALLPEKDRFLVTSAPMHESSWADVVQIYSYSDFSLLHTLDLPVGKLEDGTVMEGSQRAGFGPRVLDDGSIFLNSYGCAFYHITDVETDKPNLSMVYALDTKRVWRKSHIRGACGIPVRVGNYWIQPVGTSRAVVVLDISNPDKPREVYRLKTPRFFKPHWLAKDPQSNRFVLGAELGGEQGFFMLRFNEENGELGFDNDFNGVKDGVIYDTTYKGYLSLERPSWPHGETGTAWGHAALFLGK
ncbi:MAG: hypothetical protein ABJ081_11265 [Hyphomicrobiales bacterium]